MCGSKSEATFFISHLWKVQKFFYFDIDKDLLRKKCLKAGNSGPQNSSVQNQNCV